MVDSWQKLVVFTMALNVFLKICTESQKFHHFPLL